MRIDQFSDQELIDLYLSGDEKGIITLISRYNKYIYRYILIRVNNITLTEDIFQDTFIKVINGLRAEIYIDQGKFLAWAYTIAHNVICDHWKSLKRLPTIENKEEYDILDTIHMFDRSLEEQIVVEQIHEDVRSLLTELPDDQREVIMMRHFADMTFVEIAEETNTNLNTVLGRMRYALTNLRRLAKEKKLVLKY